jgi:hypothetical protein
VLRRPRRVQRRNRSYDSQIIDHLFSPLDAGWDGAARHPYPAKWGLVGLVLPVRQVPVCSTVIIES